MNQSVNEERTILALAHASEGPTLREQLLAADAGDALHVAYPGHWWAVSASERDGMLDVRLAMAMNWGFRIKIAAGAEYSASDLKRRVLMAGGEILERFKLSRGRARADEINGLKRDFAHNVEFDKS